MKWVILLLAALIGFAAGMWSQQREPSDSMISSSAAAVSHPKAEQPEGRIAEVLSALRMKPGLKQFAALSEPLSKLNAAQMGELMEHFERDAGVSDKDYHVSWLLTWWMERDPEAAVAWLRPRMQRLAEDGNLALGIRMGGGIPAMIGPWARRFPEDAMKLAREYPRSDMARNILAQIVGGHRGKSPSDLWPVLRDFPEGKVRASQAKLFLSKWAKADANAAFAAAQSLEPGRTLDEAFEAVLPALTAKDAALALEEYNKLGVANPELVRNMIASATAKDAAVIAEWLTRLDAGVFMYAAPSHLMRWVTIDPAAAFTWAAQHEVPLPSLGQERIESPISHAGFDRVMTTRSHLTESVLATAIARQPEATIAWLKSLPPGKERSRMALEMIWGATEDQAIALFSEVIPELRGHAAGNVAGKLLNNPDKAKKWAVTLPAGTARDQAWQILGQHTNADYNLPPGPDQDALLNGRALSLVAHRPLDDRLGLTQQISDAPRRREVFDTMMEEQVSAEAAWIREPALKWLETAKVPEDWKAKWRATPAK